MAKLFVLLALICLVQVIHTLSPNLAGGSHSSESHSSGSDSHSSESHSSESHSNESGPKPNRPIFTG